MKISVIGCGYLGAVHAASMAEIGHEVIGYDVDAHKVELLAAGRAPFVEPGLPELLQRNVEAGRLHFTTDPAQLADAQVHFIGVGTPQLRDGTGADLSYLEAAISTILEQVGAERDALVVGKSTVPVGTARRLHEQITAESRMRLMWNPEFLREGFAVEDTLAPDRIVYGLPGADDDDECTTILDEVYAPVLERGMPRLVVDLETAELVKVAANSFLATKISFINAMAEMCEKTGGDVTRLAEAIGMDDRIGAKFLRAGIGFGGGCLPKDIRAFMTRAGEIGVPDSLAFLREIDAVNKRARKRAVEHVRMDLDGVAGKRIAVLGGAFKPNSDDIRDSPSIAVAVRLLNDGADVYIYDPVANVNIRGRHPALKTEESLEDVLRGAEAVVLGTEWDEFRGLDPAWAKDLVKNPYILDGRNVLDPAVWREAGWEYRGMGR